MEHLRHEKQKIGMVTSIESPETIQTEVKPGKAIILERLVGVNLNLNLEWFKNYCNVKKGIYPILILQHIVDSTININAENYVVNDANGEVVLNFEVKIVKLFVLDCQNLRINVTNNFIGPLETFRVNNLSISLNGNLPFISTEMSENVEIKLLSSHSMWLLTICSDKVKIMRGEKTLGNIVLNMFPVRYQYRIETDKIDLHGTDNLLSYIPEKSVLIQKIGEQTQFMNHNAEYIHQVKFDKND